MSFLDDILPIAIGGGLGLVFVIAIYRLSNRYAGTLIGPNVVQEFEAVESKAIAQLGIAGSCLGEPHVINFFFYFPHQADAQKISTALIEEGFEARIQESQNDESRRPWLLVATIKVAPTIKTLTRYRMTFTRLADPLGGVYDGWEATVVPQPDD